MLENQTVFHSFANGAQPSSHKLSGDVTGMVLVLLVGRTYVASPVQVNLLAVVMDKLEFRFTLTDMKTQERNPHEGREK